MLWKQRKYYHSSVDTLPMWNWQKMNETRDFGYLNGEAKHIEDETIESVAYFNAIYTTFIHYVGLGYDYNKLLSLKRLYLIKRSEYLETNDMQSKMKSKLLAIDIEDKEREMQDKAQGKESETTIIIEKNLGYKLNLKEITVSEYYDYVQFFTQQANQN
tara:strand:- start:235 stop:711 length:477 start_codon:yes stop_codon:yes gene_type:complete